MELFLCGPQAVLPSPQELSELRRILLDHENFCKSLTSTLKDLKSLYGQLIAFDSTLKGVPEAPSIDFLLQWLESGTLSVPANNLPNAGCLPFAVLLQIALFLRHLTESNIGSDYRQKIQSLQQYGVQGFCTGFLTAAAIAFSENEEQLVKNTATSLRLAMCIGAYIDDNVLYNETLSSPCALSVRWNEAQFSKSQVEDLLADYEHVRSPRPLIYPCSTAYPQTRLISHASQTHLASRLLLKRKTRSA